MVLFKCVFLKIVFFMKGSCMISGIWFLCVTFVFVGVFVSLRFGFWVFFFVGNRFVLDGDEVFVFVD